MGLVDETCAAILPVDLAAARQAQSLLDAKTKPRRSLGELENVACRLAAIYRTPLPALPNKAVVIMAADHGVADESVSAYPAEVTAQMVRNFAAGGAAINVLARQAGTRIVVVDMGTKTSTAMTGVLNRRLGSATANFTRGPAMAPEVAERAVDTGIELVAELAGEGVSLIALGDMGIANTTSASALTAVLTGTPIGQVTGRGTGIDDARLKHKTEVISRALEINKPDARNPIDVLVKVGGFEIGGLAGVILGAAARRMPVVLDGFITASAALIATAVCPRVRDYLIAGHCSVEPGNAIALHHLDLRPLLDLHMRLGEGTGAVLAMNLIEASLRILNEMATFATAEVTDTGA